MPPDVPRTVRACASAAEAAVLHEIEMANRCRDEGLREEEGQHRYAALAIGEIVDAFRGLANGLERQVD